MGAARRDPRGSEILRVRRSPQFCCLPKPGEVVSNTGKIETCKGLDIRSNGTTRHAIKLDKNFRNGGGWSLFL